MRYIVITQVNQKTNNTIKYIHEITRFASFPDGYFVDKEIVTSKEINSLLNEYC